jgi:SAM-dependent methyltransferase
VEFIVAAALALPFCRDDFATVSVIKLLEKVPDPIRHLKEVNRVLCVQDGMFLFSDPFSLDEAFSSPEKWLSGNRNRQYSARGIDTLRRMFAGEFSVFTRPLNVDDGGDVHWTIRKTENLMGAYHLAIPRRTPSLTPIFR